MDTLPSPSTACSFRTIACSFAIFCVPKERTIVTIELNASGIAATARATAKRNAFPIFSPRKTLIPNKIAQNTRIKMDNFCPNWSRFTCNGVFFSDVVFRRLAILPTSVFIPISVTTKEPLPYVRKLPEYTILIRSPRGTSSCSITSVVFSTPRLSPVNALSSTFMLAHSRIRPSAGI